MKSLQLLKLSIDICFIILIIDVIFSFFTYLMLILYGEPFTVTINDSQKEIVDLNFSSGLLIISNFAVTLLSTYAIYLLRKLIRSFFKNSFFTKLQIALFRLIGQLIVLSVVLQFIVHFFSTMLLEKRLEIGVSVDSGYYSSLFILSIGLFFIYMSKLFKKSRSLQEENDLTV
ncbi:DUF2975 domain-containing protein [Gillisia sp. Hel_I_29]|uniref:DUF2975 domain-containing protein n=1 Tax=Gillisia sp. Hel_I_29 TaxID=1249975 RepID=UPI0009DFD9A3|nr:DUF2975 domain-containing protein [Gillisia sp. Hel_I_29]